jgi:hypothetical protein
MILVIYQLICVVIALVIIRNLFQTKDLQEKIVNGFILVPLVLRALLLK